MREYKPEDYEQIMSWWVKRDKAPISPDLFSDLGFIVDGVAAVFLYTTNSKIAYLECMICNPDVDKSITDKALNDLTELCSEAARQMGYKALMATATNPNVIIRAVKNGFKVEPGHTLLVKAL